jgi:guanylate kinase
VRAAYPTSISVFILPPSASVLLDRLRGRRTESAAAVAQRVEIAVDELGGAMAYDHIVVNQSVDRTVDRILELVRHPERVEHRSMDMVEHFQELIAGLQMEAQKLHDALKEPR